MNRTNGAGHVGHMFVSEDAAAGREPTSITDAWLNSVQEEIISPISASGQALNQSDNTQLLKAIRWLIAEKSFPARTCLLFHQEAAPTGWTQVTDDHADNRMLRVVTGDGSGVGGTHNPIECNVVAAHTHGFTTGDESNDHTHGIGDPGHIHYSQYDGRTPTGIDYIDSNDQIAGVGTSFFYPTSLSATGIWTGGHSGTHTHAGSTDNGSSGTNFQPRYINLILCIKD